MRQTVARSRSHFDLRTRCPTVRVGDQRLHRALTGQAIKEPTRFWLRAGKFRDGAGWNFRRAIRLAPNWNSSTIRQIPIRDRPRIAKRGPGKFDPLTDAHAPINVVAFERFKDQAEGDGGAGAIAHAPHSFAQTRRNSAHIIGKSDMIAIRNAAHSCSRASRSRRGKRRTAVSMARSRVTLPAPRPPAPHRRSRIFDRHRHQVEQRHGCAIDEIDSEPVENFGHDGSPVSTAHLVGAAVVLDGSVGGLVHLAVVGSVVAGRVEIAVVGFRLRYRLSHQSTPRFGKG